MTTFNDQVYQSGGAPIGNAGVPWGPNSKYFWCDPTNGSDSADGLTPKTAKLTIKAAYDLTTNNQNDTVFMIGGATASYVTTTGGLVWSNSYTHLVGLSADLPGLGQRCRIIMQAATASTPVVTFSGAGCLIRNVQISNETASGSARGVVLVSGLRNLFENVFFMAPTSSTAASYSCKVTSSENVFIRCTFGQYTNFRDLATRCLWIEGAGVVSRNKFIDCEFLSWSGGTPAAHVHVLFDVDLDAVPTMTIFENCLFANNYGGGTIMVQSIDDNCTASGHQILLKGKNSFVGCTAVADTLTYIFNQSKFAGGLMAALTEA